MMSLYQQFRGTELPKEIYKQNQNKLEPAFREMLDQGYTDVTFALHHGIHESQFDGERWTLHQGNFIFTSPEKDSFGWIVQQDNTLDTLYGSTPPKILGNFALEDLRKMLSNAPDYSRPENYTGPRYDIENCSEPADLKLVLQEGHFNVPPSPHAVPLKKTLTPLIVRAMERVFNFLRDHGIAGKQEEVISLGLSK